MNDDNIAAVWKNTVVTKRTLCQHVNPAKYKSGLTSDEVLEVDSGNMIQCVHCSGYHLTSDIHDDFLTAKEKAVKRIKQVLNELDENVF